MKKVIIGMFILFLIGIVFQIGNDNKQEIKTNESLIEETKLVFNEEDFYWDENTLPYKEIIIAGVNKIYQENDRCKEIDPSSVYISGSKGTKENPVFYVTCGSGCGSTVHNVFFSKSDVEQDIKLVAKKHIDQTEALKLCKTYVKQHVKHPSTVKFPLWNTSVFEHANGRTSINLLFKTKNDFNLEIEYKIHCLFDENGLIEANIKEN